MSGPVEHAISGMWAYGAHALFPRDEFLRLARIVENDPTLTVAIVIEGDEMAIRTIKAETEEGSSDDSQR